jgi:cell division protein FtsA
MRKPVLITGLDISSSKISAIALEVSASGHSTIVAHASHASKGVQRGIFTDIASASNVVGGVLALIGEKTGRKADNIIANISGESVKGERSKGMIPLSSRGREVTVSDAAKCIDAASTIRLAFDTEIIHSIVLNFSIDDQPPIKSALGLYASRLYCEMYMITAASNHIQNVYKCVNDAGYDIKDIVYSGIADSESLLDASAKEEGIALVNIGATLTELSVFSGGALMFLDVSGAGVNDIKGTLAGSREFESITAHLRSKIEEAAKKGAGVASVTLAGGCSFVEGAADIIEERLSLPVRIGNVKNIHGSISGAESLSAVTAIGGARYAAHEYEPRAVRAKNVAKKISNKVSEIFNSYF